MGIPITTYTVLDSLASDLDAPHFRGLVAPFNLFAFVLGSPKDHPGLFAKIDSAFDRLAFETGERLLFFAVARPSTLRGQRSRVYANFVEYQPPSIGPDHEAALANTLALGLGVPQSALPCLVATTDLKSKDLVWFGTSEVFVAEQLRRLGYLAWQHNRDELGSVLLDEQMNFDPTKPSGFSSLDTSVAQTIADVLSFPVYRTGRHRAGRDDFENATERARQTLGGIFDSIKKQKRKSDPSPDAEPDPALLENIESNSFKGLSCLSLLSERPDVSLFEGPLQSMDSERSAEFSYWMPSKLEPEVRSQTPEDYEGPLFSRCELPGKDEQRWPNLRRLGESLEAESVHMLKTALLVQDLFDSRPELVNGLLEDQLDYTPTVICLAKVFEREANLSVVHWIRQHLRISLPQYFNRHQPEIHAVFTPDRPNAREIDFNMEKNGSWVAPGLGQSEMACRAFGRTCLPEGWSRNKWSRLMDSWYVIRVGRNSAAHTELIDKESATRIGREIDRLAEHRIFASMCALKAKFRGPRQDVLK
jgi:hypothetical protein